MPIATTGCPIDASGNITPLVRGVTTPGGTGCRLVRHFGISNPTHDLFWKARLDHPIGDKNKVWYAFSWEKGVQATYTDAVNPVFNAYSTQPQNGLSIGWTHVFSPTLVNDFNPGYYWYSAIFKPNDFPKALAASPFEFTGGGFSPIFGAIRSWPQGRNVTQYQLIDNLTWTRSSHTLKFGENLRRTLVSDHDPGTRIYPYINLGNIVDYSLDVVGSSAQLSFPTSTSEPIGIVSLDHSAQDTWKVKSNLTFTYGLRATWNSNPIEQHGNFAKLKNGSFFTLNHDVNVPYNQIINPHTSLLA